MLGLLNLIKTGRTMLPRGLGFTLPAVLATLMFLIAGTASASAEDRTLFLYYTHTKETARITFKRNGRYDTKALSELNYFLRDWRRNEPTKMDPQLFDLVWEVYQSVGATGPIYVVSAYRSPQTNAMLRSRTRGVAKESRHMLGKAMDFYIPGVPLKKLRETAMRLQVGGVGYYPTSGSPFVHLDTGNVRAWPRMTRTQLASLFPQGKTLHVPADGKLLSAAGYNYAKTQWQKCHEVPCTGSIFSNTRIASADRSAPTPAGPPERTLMDAIFGNGDNQTATSRPDTPAPTNALPASAPTIALAQIASPTPLPLPKDLRPAGVVGASGAPAPLPPQPAPVVQLASAQIAPVPAPPRNASEAVASLGESAPIPAPRVLLTPKPEAPQPPTAPVLTAYAPDIAPEPSAQRAVQMLVSRKRAEAGRKPATPSFNTRDLRPATASISPELNGFAALFNGLRNGLRNQGTQHAQLSPKEVDLHAPDFDHIVEIFLDTAALDSPRYAVIFDKPDADLTQRSDLGNYAGILKFGSNPEGGLGIGRFVRGQPTFSRTPRS